ncbi:MAG TPA: hypothetical protein VNK43_06810 [Gemmatimonadales bacterium]|nr:hypothetical protein [Gemmatimonadales bacterium]
MPASPRGVLLLSIPDSHLVRARRLLGAERAIPGPDGLRVSLADRTPEESLALLAAARIPVTGSRVVAPAVDAVAPG